MRPAICRVLANLHPLSHTINQSNAGIESRINDVIDALFEDLYPTIAAAARNFIVPTQTLQKKINRISPWSSRSPTNKAFSKAKKKIICKYIERLDS